LREPKDKKTHRSCKLTRILILLITFIVMLTSVANAAINTFNPSPVIANQPFTDTVSITDNTIRAADITIYHNTGNEIVTDYTSPKITIDNVGTVTFNVEHGLDAGLYFCVPEFYDASGVKLKSFYKEIAYALVIQDPTSSIPEFPSVALPVAAILGLVMIFGRRKNTV
jgi:hypothetical protein